MAKPKSNKKMSLEEFLTSIPSGCAAATPGGDIVIRIAAKTLPKLAALAQKPVRVTDPHIFAQDIAEFLSDDQPNDIQEWFASQLDDAIEHGWSAGTQEISPARAHISLWTDEE